MIIENNKIAKKYHDNGFVIMNKLICSTLIESILLEIFDFIESQAKKLGIKVDDNIDQTILNVMKPETELRSFIYDIIRYNRSLQKIIYSDDFSNILETIGFKQPIALESPTIRVDIPGEIKFITPPHQDIRSIRSKKCVTIWIPFRKCNKTLGTLALYSKSHRGGLRKYEIIGTQNTISKKDKNRLSKYKKIIVKAMPGDVIFMNSFLIHESVASNNFPIKLNAQIIINDAINIKYGDKFYKMDKIPETKDLL
ncbi:MAG: phytanoyl-CoA dioxygenase family protein [Candidatus Neomarinimicrobiota bacterium]